jgi:SpoVK/Ycf46/Vps4 family AAA+-type ATPase
MVIMTPQLEAQIERFTRCFFMRDKLKEHSLPAPTKLLLVGPPGNGKSSAARELARRCRLETHEVLIGEVVDSHMGGTSSRLEAAFKRATSSGLALILDEFDAVSHRRTEVRSGAEAENSRIVASLLQMMDRGGPPLVIATTNLSVNIDGAVLRRFDSVVHVPAPEAEDCRRLAIALCVKHDFRHAFVEGLDFGAFRSYAEVEAAVIGIFVDAVLKEGA